MKALLLAAGEGTRLGALTSHRPKPMIEIGGRPILEYNVRLLARHGYRDVVINLHHCPSVITSHFGDGSAFGVNISYSFEPTLLGTAGAAKNVFRPSGGPFLVIYADNLTNCNLSELAEFHRSKNAAATMALIYRENATASGVAELGSDQKLVRFVEKPQSHQVFSPWVSAGILLLEPKVLDFIPATPPSDFGRDVFPALLAADLPVCGFKLSDGLWWIDSPADLDRTRRMFSSGQVNLP